MNPIKEIREARGLSLQQLATKLKTSRVYIIRLEQGVTPGGPSRGLAARLSALDPQGRSPAMLIEAYRTARSEQIRNFHLRLVGETKTERANYNTIKRAALEYAMDYYTPTTVLPHVFTDAKPNAKHSNVVTEAVSKHPLYLFRTFLFDYYGLPLSAIKFCSLTGMHPATLSQIEKGRMSLSDSVTSQEDVFRDVLGFTTEELTTLHRMCDQCLT